MLGDDFILTSPLFYFTMDNKEKRIDMFGRKSSEPVNIDMSKERDSQTLWDQTINLNG